MTLPEKGQWCTVYFKDGTYCSARLIYDDEYGVAEDNFLVWEAECSDDIDASFYSVKETEDWKYE